MAVKHIMKDGTVLDSIDGHVVKMKDVPYIYTVIDQMNSKPKRREKNEHHI